MTEDAFVGTNVRGFASKHKFDPKLGHKLFFQ